MPRARARRRARRSHGTPKTRTGRGHRWTRALASLGLRAEPTTASLSSLLARVGRGAPLLVRGTLDGRDGVLVLSDRFGGRARVEDASSGDAVWLSRAALARALGGTEDLTALCVDAALPLASAAGAHGDHPTPLRRLARLARLDHEDVATILIYAVAVGVLGLATPIAVQAMVTTVAFGTLLQPLFVLTGILLAALGLSALFRALHAFVVETLQQRFFVRVVADLAYRLPRVRREALDGRSAPELVNRFFDVFTVQKAAASLLVGGIELVLTAVVGMLVLAFYHPLLLALDVVLMLSVIAICVGPWSRGTRTAIDESRQRYAIAWWLQELVRHDVELKVAGVLRFAEDRASDLARNYIEARRAHFRVAHGQLIAMLGLQAIASAALLGLGGWLVIERQLTLGQLVAAELVVTAVVGSLAKLGRYLEIGYDTLAGLDKLGHLIDLPIERDGGDVHVLRGPASIRLEQVDAGYAGNDVLRAATLRIEARERVAISGHAASGKSLLVELLGGLRTPGSGRIRIDGRDLRELDLPALRDGIAVITRAAVVEGTVLDNVRMARAEIDPAQARRALTAVGLDHELDTLADGASTELSVGGGPLSASQALRLTIARAIAARPSVVILDQLLDGLDDDALEPVLATLTDPDAPWTLVIATQDPRVRDRCGRTVRVIGGRIEEVTA